jgi:hypothetical protein
MTTTETRLTDQAMIAAQGGLNDPDSFQAQISDTRNMLDALERNAIALQQAQIHGRIYVRLTPRPCGPAAIYLHYMPRGEDISRAERLASGLGLVATEPSDTETSRHHYWDGTIGGHPARLVCLETLPIRIDDAEAAAVEETR